MSALNEIIKKQIQDMSEIEYCLYRVSFVNIHCYDSAIIAAAELTAMREKIEHLENTIAETNAWFVENGHEGTPPQRKLIDLLLETQ